MSWELVNHQPALCPSGCRTLIVKRGRYLRKGKSVQRYLCKSCGTSFCEDISSDCYREKKPELRRSIFLLLNSGISQRRLSRLLGISRVTLVRKFIKLGVFAHLLSRQDLCQFSPAREIEFDDLETFCHTKCKPLSVSLAVESNSRRILGFRVSEMPAKGRLAALSRKRYGPRQDERSERRGSLFKEIQAVVAENALIRSDMNPHYAPDVKTYFPKATHDIFRGRRGCVVGQGELKRGGFDPLFSLNHTCAMMRANINRLFRRTWNTTKKKERLALHLSIYMLFHNRYLIWNQSV